MKILKYFNQKPPADGTEREKRNRKRKLLHNSLSCEQLIKIFAQYQIDQFFHPISKAIDRFFFFFFFILLVAAVACCLLLLLLICHCTALMLTQPGIEKERHNEMAKLASRAGH